MMDQFRINSSYTRGPFISVECGVRSQSSFISCHRGGRFSVETLRSNFKPGGSFATSVQCKNATPPEAAQFFMDTPGQPDGRGGSPPKTTFEAWDALNAGDDDARAEREKSCGDIPRRESREFRPTEVNTIGLGETEIGPKDGKEAVVDGQEAVVDGSTSVEGETSSRLAVLDGQTNATSLPSPIHKTEGTTPGWSRRPWRKDGFGRAGKMTSNRLDDRAVTEDWRDIIDIVTSVKAILQTYQPEERLNDEDQQLLLTQVLPHHPNSAEKVGCGVDYIKVAVWKASSSKCFHVVRFDGTVEDFSYHKCLKERAANKDPRLDDMYAVTFQPWTISQSFSRFSL